MASDPSHDFVIETPRLALRRFTTDDIDFLTLLLGDPVTMSHWQAPLTRAEAASWLQRAVQSYAADGFGRWLVLHKDRCQPIGDVGIQKLSIPDRHDDPQWENDLGYIIHRDQWGHGFGFEAASACVDWARGHGLKSVIATMAEDNLSSIRTAERLGMNLERRFNNPRNRGKTTQFYRLELAVKDLPAGG
jgi:RimJ/RimL family protein N-acetyltransferase